MKRKAACILVSCMLLSLLSVGMMADTTDIIIHYQRPDGEYAPWNIWAWPDGGEGAEYPFNGEDSFGKTASISVPGSSPKIGFLVRTGDWDKDVETDRFVEIAQGNEIWVISGNPVFTYEAPEGYGDAPRPIDKLTLNIHYNRYDGAYAAAAGSLAYEKGGSTVTEAVSFSSGDDSFGALGTVTLTGITSAAKPKLTITSGDARQEFSIPLFKAEGASHDIYLALGKARVGADAEELNVQKAIKSAVIFDTQSIEVTLGYPLKTDGTAPDGFSLSGGASIEEVTVVNEGGDDEDYGKLQPGYATVFALKTVGELSMEEPCTVEMKGYGQAQTTIGNIFEGKGFEKSFLYDGEDLGASYTPQSTTFRVWAPTAATAVLNLYDTGTQGEGEAEVHPMKQDEKGTWVYTAEGDLKGKYYTYTVHTRDKDQEAVDPYAKAAGVDGMRGMVIDLKETDPEGWEKDKRPPFLNPTDAIIYELHVRDFSVDAASGIKNAGKFLAFTENGTSLNGEGKVKTGVDHLVELGITHLHLLPSFDFRSIKESELDQNRFNWGYDPQNYNLPEGSYSTDPYNGAARVTEFKKMVQSLHKNGIRVVMDVVYNHTGATADSNLNKLVPNYYYRQDAKGRFANGSGCGNETASERGMVRKMIVDSVTYWASEYNVDGFRFDLMGLHDVETMNQVRAALDKIDPSIIVYGEGWTGGASPLDNDKAAVKANTKKLDDRIAVFSDDMRDAIKGSVFTIKDPGFVNGKPNAKNKIMFGVAAGMAHEQITQKPWANQPSQVITYASAHDNNTLWDKLILTNPEADDKTLTAMNKLAATLVLTSQGIPFIHAGEELARSKPKAKGGYDENSYMSPDEVNKIRWERKVTYQNLFEYYQGLIALRKAHPAFRLQTADDIASRLSFVEDTAPEVLAYTLNGNAGSDRAETIAVVLNTDAEKSAAVKLPESGWEIYANGDKAGTTPLGELSGDTLTAEPQTAYVLMRNVAPEPTEAETEVPTEADLGSASPSPSKGIPRPLLFGGAIVFGAVIGVLLRLRRKKA